MLKEPNLQPSTSPINFWDSCLERSGVNEDRWRMFSSEKGAGPCWRIMQVRVTRLLSGVRCLFKKRFILIVRISVCTKYALIIGNYVLSTILVTSFLTLLAWILASKSLRTCNNEIHDSSTRMSIFNQIPL